MDNKEPTNFIKCKKDLYKSTYEQNAFNENKKYEITGKEIEKNMIWLKDEAGHIFNFCLKPEFPYFCIEDYFEYDTASRKVILGKTE